ncbi:hypothetical protein, partial [Paenibacillus sp. DS2015]|uniref:hypothetical protein n=1 Tax=Paenibacillus sp. DS2015 TaxID=3373917 RepID=UPI003D211CD7
MIGSNFVYPHTEEIKANSSIQLYVGIKRVRGLVVELNRYAVAFQILQTFSAIHQAFLYHLVKKEV